MKSSLFAGLAAATALSGMAHAGSIEVAHWWTSDGESAAVREIATAFDATGNTWIDAAIAGGAGAALPVIISRITGGNPMGATMLIHGRQAEELVAAGLMQDLTPLADEEGWRDAVRPASLLDSCSLDGRIYCVPVNIHSQQWLWLSKAAFDKAGIEMPVDFPGLVAAAPKLAAAGIQPLALGRQPWQSLLVLNVVMASVGGPELYQAVYGDKSADAIEGEDMTRVLDALAQVRMLAEASRVQDWNEATNMVITGQAAGQIMGDWTQAEFRRAGLEPGTDYACLPGMGLRDIVSTGGNAFYFPKLGDEAATRTQMVLASVMISAETQVSFNRAKGSLPVRGDVDPDDLDPCTTRGLDILADGSTVPAIEQLITPDTQGSLTDLASRFLSDPSMTTDDMRRELAEIISWAE